MRSLESGNLIEDWAKWRREFNIHLASEVTDVLDNKAILHLFLDSLGAEGCALVHSLCPQLQKENQDQWTFDEVWWRFNQHCLVKQDPVVEAILTANFLKERKELRRISYGDIEKVRKVIKTSHFPSSSRPFLHRTSHGGSNSSPTSASAKWSI